MNKNGGKLLAALAIFAMVMCAIAVAVPASDAAVEKDGMYLDQAVSGTYSPNEAFSITNEMIGNELTFVKDESSTATDVKYTISGTVNYIGTNDEIKSAGEGATDAQKNFFNSKTAENTFDIPYGIVYSLVYNEYSYVLYPGMDSAVPAETVDTKKGLNVLTYVAPGNTDSDTITFQKAETSDPTTDIKVTVSYDLTFVGEFACESITYDDVTIDTPVDGLYVKKDANGNAVFVGEAVGIVDNSVTLETDDTFQGVFANANDNGAVPWGYSAVEIKGLESFIQDGGKVVVEQVNAALKAGAAYAKDKVDTAFINQDTWTKTKAYDTAGLSPGYALLVPKDNSVVTVTVYAAGADGNKTGSALATYKLDFSKISYGAITVSDASSIQNALSSGEDVVVTEDVTSISTTTSAPLEIDAGQTLTIANLTTESTFSVSVDGVQVDFTGLKGKNIVISQGSFQMYAEDLTGKTINVAKGDTFRFDDGTTIGEAGVKFTGEGTVLIPKSATVTLSGNMTFDGSVSVDVKGALKAAVDADGKKVTGLVINLGANTSFTFVGNLDGISIVDADGAKIINANTSFENTTLDGINVNNETTYSGSENYSYTINDEVTVQIGGNFVIGGKLVIPADMSLVVEKGGILNIKNTAVADIAGELVLKEGAIFTYDGQSMTVSGTMTVEGALDAVNGKGFVGQNITVSGTMNIEEKATVSLGTAVTVAAGGNLNINGGISGTSSTVVNAGTVTIDSDVQLSGITIQMRDGGKLDAQNVYGTVTVTDSGMEYKVEGTMTPIATPNEITLKDVTGVIVSETLTMSTNEAGDRIGTNHMFVSGNIDTVNIKDVDTSAVITVKKGETVEVADELTLAEESVLTIQSGLVTVTGTLTATADKTEINGSGALTVTGTVVSKEPVADSVDLNAAHYEATVDNVKLNYYTTLEAALAAGADEIDVFGDITVTADATIPVGTDVTMKPQSTITVKEDVTLSVAAEGKTSGSLDNTDGTVYVNGTLYVADLERSDVDKTSVISESPSSTSPPRPSPASPTLSPPPSPDPPWRSPRRRASSPSPRT